jgi:hypothetical protein
VYLTQTVTTHIQENPELEESDLRDPYGSVNTAVLTLYMAISGGADWGDLADPLVADISGLWSFFYSFYIALFTFAVLNVVTGVVVDKAMSTAADDRDNVIHEELNKQMTFMEDVRVIFSEGDDDGSDDLTYTEFKKHLNDVRVQAYFSALELDISDSESLFNLFDTEGNGTVSQTEFLEGCLKLKGNARKVDVATLNHTSAQLARDWTHFSHHIEERFDWICHKLDAFSGGNSPTKTSHKDVNNEKERRSVGKDLRYKTESEMPGSLGMPNVMNWCEKADKQNDLQQKPSNDEVAGSFAVVPRLPNQPDGGGAPNGRSETLV